MWNIFKKKDRKKEQNEVDLRLTDPKLNEKLKEARMRAKHAEDVHTKAIKETEHATENLASVSLFLPPEGFKDFLERCKNGKDNGNGKAEGNI